MTEGARGFRHQPPHGTLAEEAVKLAETAQQWLRDLSERSDPETGEVWAEATSGADTAPDCRTCPICRARRFVRAVDPVVLAHISDAAASLSAAARAMSRQRTAGRR